MDFIQSESYIIKGIFLLILAISGNFVAETLGCKTQKILSENIYMKHLVILFILYFSVGFASDEPEHPLNILKMAFYIYILFLFFTKMNLYFTGVVFLLLSICYILSTFIDYYEYTGIHTDITIDTLTNIRKMIYISLMPIIIIGFILYFKNKRNEYKTTWSTLKFIFGKVNCNSMKMIKKY